MKNDMLSSSQQRPARQWLMILSLLIPLLLQTSCRNSELKRYREPAPNLVPVIAPLFLNQDIALLFTNLSGFTAKVDVERPVDAVPSLPTRLSGELLGRNGNLLFILEQTGGRWDAKDISNWGTTYLWKNADNLGYALNEPLQGYAPIKPATYALPHYEITALGNESVHDEPCEKSRLSYQLATNTIVSYTVWRAPALNLFPVKIQTTVGHAVTTWNFSKVQSVKLRGDALEIPVGFSRFESNESMLDEIARRASETERGGIRAMQDYYERNPYGEGRPKERGK